LHPPGLCRRSQYTDRRRIPAEGLIGKGIDLKEWRSHCVSLSFVTIEKT
jgi:hypothetical protein